MRRLNNILLILSIVLAIICINQAKPCKGSQRLNPFRNKAQDRRYNINKVDVKQTKTTLAPQINAIISELKNRNIIKNDNLKVLIKDLKKVFQTTAKTHLVCAKCRLNPTSSAIP